MGTKKAKTTSKKLPKVPAPAVAAAFTVHLGSGARTTKTESKPIQPAPAIAASTLDPATLVELPLDLIVPTTENPRHHRLTTKDPAVIELAQSIGGIGLLEPVIVRKHPSRPGFYELRAGERRYLAHQVNKAKTIRALIWKMDDQTAREVTTLENLQREDLKPLEEAQAVGILLKGGASFRDVGAKIGKSHQWVARRASLTKLIPEWVKRFEKYNTPPGTMELIARYQPEEQKELLKDIDAWVLEYQDADDIQHALNRRMRPLSGIIWKMDEKLQRLDVTKGTALAAVVGFPTCSECKNRTSQRGVAFEGPDRCLNGKCYDAKHDAALAKREAELKKEHPNLVKLGNGSRGTLADHKVIESKPNAKGAIPALVVSGSGVGKLKWVKNRYEEEPLNLPGPKSLKDKKAELESKRWCEVVKRFREHLEETLLTALKDPMTAICLTAAFGTGFDDCGDWNTFDKLQKLPAAEQLRLAADRMWRQTRGVISNDLAYNGPVTSYPLEQLTDCRKIAKLIQFDLDALYAAVCKEKGFTVPACWTATNNSQTGSK